MSHIEAELNLDSVNLRLEGAEMVDTATGEHFTYDGKSEGIQRPQRMVEEALGVLKVTQITFEDPWSRKFSTSELPEGTALERARHLASLRSQNGERIWSVLCNGRKVEPTH